MLFKKFLEQPFFQSLQHIVNIPASAQEVLHIDINDIVLIEVFSVGLIS
jgi:hypothetical protein